MAGPEPGWRRGQAVTHRSSVTPNGDQEFTLPKLRYCEDLYAREGLRAIFRITTIAQEKGLDDLLVDRGYDSIDRTLVLALALESGGIGANRGFALTPLASFLATYGRLSDSPALE